MRRLGNLGFRRLWLSQLALAAFAAVAIHAQAGTVAPAATFSGKRVVILKAVLQPGDRSAAADPRYDRVDIVVRGTLRTGTADAVGPGWARFSRAGLNQSEFTNAGPGPAELVVLEINGGIQGTTVPPNLPPGSLPPNQARLVTDRVVPAKLLVDNDRIRMVRWDFRPGECSPVHIHALDHVYVVIRGSLIREITGEGVTHDDHQETGRAAFSPAKGKIHSFGNVGAGDYEMVSVELK